VRIEKGQREEKRKRDGGGGGWNGPTKSLRRRSEWAEGGGGVVVACWGVEVLRCWGVGVLGCWGVGVLGCWGGYATVLRWDVREEGWDKRLTNEEGQEGRRATEGNGGRPHLNDDEGSTDGGSDRWLPGSVGTCSLPPSPSRSAGGNDKLAILPSKRWDCAAPMMKLAPEPWEKFRP
jgi:hypothetical protein